MFVCASRFYICSLLQSYPLRFFNEEPHVLESVSFVCEFQRVEER